MRRILSFHKKTSGRIAVLADRSVSRREMSLVTHACASLENLKGYSWSHNLVDARDYSRIYLRVLSLISRFFLKFGLPIGDVTTVAQHQSDFRKSLCIIATNDNVGIPLLLFRAVTGIRFPMIYGSIGFPEKLTKMSAWVESILKPQFRELEQIYCYGWEESLSLKRWLRWSDGNSRVKWLPYCVDDEFFKPKPEKSDKGYVLSIGADPMRDFGLLLQVAVEMPQVSFKIIASRDHEEVLKQAPSNVEVIYDVDLQTFRAVALTCSFVVLPVKENTYTGATTTLLQVMALGKAAVVSRVQAIKEGYGFKNEENCLLVKPHDKKQLIESIAYLEKDGDLRKYIGENARSFVSNHHRWELLESTMSCLVESLFIKNRWETLEV